MFKHKNKGFTLIEMIVTLAVLSIVLSLTVSGLLAWQDWANFKRQDEYAQTLFVAAQNQLAEFSADGRLKEMQEEFAEADSFADPGAHSLIYSAVGLNISRDIEKLVNSEGDTYKLEELFPESKDKDRVELYQDEIVSLRAETGDYKKYLADPENFKKTDAEAYWVFELLGAYVYDTTILNGEKGGTKNGGNGAAICVEITPEDGQVLAVLYSDRNDQLVYTMVPGDKKLKEESAGISDISNRTESYRQKRMVGYYGVDTLYAATKNEMVQPSVASVRLHNKDTFYLTYKLSSKYQPMSQTLDYVLDLNPTPNINEKKLTVKLDGKKLKNEDNAEAIDCVVSRYDIDGNEIEIGTFPILAWIEKDMTIHVVYDAADVQATTDLYEAELKNIRDNEKVATTKFAKTYSFFRFGVLADNVYATVVAKGEGYTASKPASNFGNLNPLKNQSEKHTVFAGENTESDQDGHEFEYSITNARHLYNVRYIEDLSYELAAGSKAAKDQIKKVSFTLKSNVDWDKFEKNGQFYNSKGTIKLTSLNGLITDAEGKPIETVTTKNCDFPSISRIRERDEFDGNGKTISGIRMSEISNALYGIYNGTGADRDTLVETKPTALFNLNYGEIMDLKLDDICSSGSQFVGGFCGINAGTVEKLLTLDTKEHSRISGLKNVGGVIGFQLPTSNDLVVQKLENNATVMGVNAVGGIVGMIRNDYSNINLDELDGLSNETIRLLNNANDLKITIKDCENYGAIYGENASKLSGIYVAKGSEFAENNKAGNDEPTEPRYIGGIVGYCYNVKTDDTEQIKVEDCTSAPQYNDETLLAILANDDLLAEKLKGVYVGGIIGYNYFGEISHCSTLNKKKQEGYLFGYRYVGGIVGFNIGPASGIIGSKTNDQGENNNHVIAYEYAGGITGCNASVRNVDSEGNEINSKADMDPENLEGLLLPDAKRSLNVKINNWINKGIVIATHEYSGGITGYNAGFIYRCNTVVEADTADKYFNTLYSGNYSGGVAGYNNGIIGNTEREVNQDGTDSKIVTKGEKLSTVCYVKGHNYVGGVVGYNDVDSIVEDYEISSGYVLGDTGSCYVGGYAGLNASVELLMDTSKQEHEARFIHSNPNRVEGDYFVGGTIGGNIINTINMTDGDSDTHEDESQETDEKVYATFKKSNINHSGDKYETWTNVVVYNDTDRAISCWSFEPWEKDTVKLESISTENGKYDEDRNLIKWSQTYHYTINAHGNQSIPIHISSSDEDVIKNLFKEKIEVKFYETATNAIGIYKGVYTGEKVCDVDFKVDQKNGNGCQYSLNIKNLTGDIYPNFRAEFDLPEGAKVDWQTTNCDQVGNIYGLFLNNTNSTLPINGNETMTFHVTFNGTSDAEIEKFNKTEPRIYFNNVCYNSEKKGGSGSDDEKPITIYAQYKTDNFLGVLKGKEFAGGYVGYNLLIHNSNSADWVTGDSDGHRGAVYVLQKNIVNSFVTSDSNNSDEITALSDKKRILDDLNASLNLEVEPSKSSIVISGKGIESTKTEFGMITAKIYAGGVVGYNDDNTIVTIQNVENATPIEAAVAIPYANEQLVTVNKKSVPRTKDYKGDDIEFTYSYAGGIIGKVGRYTVLNNCWNASSGTVYTQGTYTGGLCEINEGQIVDCHVSAFGSGVYDYLGGLCGLNKEQGIIDKCSFENKAVSGRNVVGGIAAENFGTIKAITLVKPKMVVTGLPDGNLDGVTGIFAGYNGQTGIIEISENIEKANVKSNGKYVGIVVGVNEGLINNPISVKEDIETNITIGGTVEGYYAVGGLIGLNKVSDSDIVIENFTNEATVKATAGNAGGIVGENATFSTIQYCVNNALVSATAGNAGGITSNNQGTITKCYDYKTVNAPKGMSGGIVAINGSDEKTKAQNVKAIVTECVVDNNGSTSSVIFTSGIAVGGIAALNSGIISNNILNNVTVKNFKDSNSTNMGIVVGSNLDMGEVILAPVQSITNARIVIEANNSNAGGIAGKNSGKIYGSSDVMYEQAMVNVNLALNYDNTDTASFANIGGVAGINIGTIENISVIGEISGKLGSSTTGYGGIAGYSGYVTEKEYDKAKTDDNIYPVTITNCTFDGKIHGIGSSGAPVRIGGITGINGYGSKIENCVIGVWDKDKAGNVTEASGKTALTAGDISKKGRTYDTVDNSSYANIGGIAGENYGFILACDNEKYSTDRVDIISFTGEAAGITAYNYEDGVVGGYVAEQGKENWLTTGRNWYIDQRCAENDHGPGGIIGISYASGDIRYVKNYANVECTYPSNNKTGGIVGSMEQKIAPYVVFENVENYGKIVGARKTGGFIGQVRTRGAQFYNCSNYGAIESGYDTGGFVGAHNCASVPFIFEKCANHGNILLLEEFEHKNARTASGFVGGIDATVGYLNYSFYDCVNTGTIAKEKVDAKNTKLGIFVGIGSDTIFIENCRNYNTYGKNVNGFVGEGGTVYYNKCFDNSNAVTTSKDNTPFGGSFKASTQGYYLDATSGRSVDYTNYGVYFGINFGNGTNPRYILTNKSYSDWKNPALFLQAPSDSNKIWVDSLNATNGDYPQFNFALEYGKTETGALSKGIDSFVVYLWNNSDNSSSANMEYSATAYFTYKDGTVLKQENITGTGAYNIASSTNMVIKNPSSDAYPINIRLVFDQKKIYTKGFAYIGKENTAKTVACHNISEIYDTSFDLTVQRRYPDTYDKYGILQAEGVEYIDNPTFGFTATSNLTADQKFYNSGRYAGDYFNYNYYKITKDDGLEYCYDYVSISRDGKRNPDPTKVSYDLVFDVKNGAKGPGMDSFVFYLGEGLNNPTTVEKNITHCSYDYSVAFTDIYGETVMTQDYIDVQGSPCMDISRQTIKVPDDLDKHITKIVVHIKQNQLVKNNAVQAPNGTVYFRGFSWIPVGENKEVRFGVGASDTGLKQVGTKLLVDYTSKYSTAGEPYVYRADNYKYGFLMNSKENDPVSVEKYYGDHKKYFDSITDTELEGSRIDVYKDMDPKIVKLLANMATKYYKLSAPTNVQVTDSSEQYHMTWDEVSDAYAYEVRYKIVDVEGKNVLPGVYSEAVRVPAGFRSYDILIDNSWVDNKYAVYFEVRAINGYHIISDSDKYDSDWSISNKITSKKALPEPQFYMEIVEGNKTTIVIDNYDDYVKDGCTDFTFKFKLAGVDYDFNVGKDGRCSEPQFIEYISNNDSEFSYSAVPNASIKEYYTSTANHKGYTRAYNNGTLPACERFCTTDFNGFYGVNPENMTYEIQYTVKSDDSYQITDISAFDENVGATVAYCTDITHTANSLGNVDVKLTSTMKNLPVKWFRADNQSEIIVRTYLYKAQFDMVKYGHEVCDGLILDGTVEENVSKLSAVVDENYFAIDASKRSANNVYDTEKGDMKDGYILQKQEDGTYSIYYSSVIAMSLDAARTRVVNNGETYRKYYKYSVDYAIYKSMKAETEGEIVVNSVDYQESYWARKSGNYSYVKNNSNKSSDVLEIQPAPIMDGKIKISQDEANHKVYSLAWDKYYKDVICYNATNKIYSSDSTAKLTNAPKGMFATWDAFCDKATHANLGATVVSYANLSSKQKRSLMNGYYNSYDNANYTVQLLGTTIDGQIVILDTQDVTTPNSLGTISSYKDGDATVQLKAYDGKTATSYEIYEYGCKFVDTGDVWGNYTTITTRIIRNGSKESVVIQEINSQKPYTNATGATYILPRYKEYSINQLLKLDTINNPSATLHTENGEIITSDLIYDVSFGAITKSSEVKDLGGYLITAKVSTAADETKVTEPHYYYVTELDASAATDTIGLDLEKLAKTGVVTEISADNYIKSGNKRTAMIDLSDFNSGDIVDISIQAIARTNAEYYEDGNPGDPNTIEIWERIKVPTMSKLSLDVDKGMPDYENATDYYVAEDLYAKNMYVAYDKEDNNYTSTSYYSTIRLEIAAAVYDNCGDTEDVSRVGAGDSLTNSWNAGAIETIYTKATPLDYGYVKTGNSIMIDISKVEEYPGQYAGKWLKIAMRATSSTKIDSQWSDQDIESEQTINYTWIHIPNLALDDIDLNAEGIDDSVVRYYYEGQILNEKPANVSESKLVPIKTQTLSFSENRNVESYAVTMLGKADDVTNIPPVHRIDLKQHVNETTGLFDGSWDVYLSADISEEMSLVGNISNNASDVQIIELPGIAANYGGYNLVAQLRFVEGEKAGSFQLVLPDVVQIDETEFADDSNYFGIMNVLVTAQLKEGTTNCKLGNSALFKRISSIENSFEIWKHEVVSLDVTAVEAWFEANHEAFEIHEPEVNADADISEEHDADESTEETTEITEEIIEEDVASEEATEVSEE